MSLSVVEEIIVRQSPEAQAIIRALVAEIPAAARRRARNCPALTVKIQNQVTAALRPSNESGSPQGGAFAAARNAKQQQRCAWDVSGIVRASAVVVDVLASRRGRSQNSNAIEA
jgi:hypothetical protein